MRDSGNLTSAERRIAAGYGGIWNTIEYPADYEAKKVAEPKKFFKYEAVLDYDAEELTVEIMEVIGELADILPCEFYFENHGYKERAEETAYDFNISYIEDDALRRLYYEEMHDQREKISA